MQRRRQIERDYSAQNARAKISTSPIFHAKVHVLKFLRFFRVLIVGRENRENFPLYGTLLVPTHIYTHLCHILFMVGTCFLSLLLIYLCSTLSVTMLTVVLNPVHA